MKKIVITQGERIPNFYGIARRNYETNTATCYLLGINLLVIVWDDFIRWLKYPKSGFWKMKRFRYYICNHNLIDIAHGRMERVIYYAKKPKQCKETWCVNEQFLETMIELVNPIKDATKSRKNKTKGNLRNRLPGRNKRWSRLLRIVWS